MTSLSTVNGTAHIQSPDKPDLKRKILKRFGDKI